MKKFFIGSLFGLVLGGFLGFAVGILVFPYLFPPPAVNEVVLGKTPIDVVATGQFVHANTSDPLHYGKGRVTVYSDVLHLEPDFEVGPGPKFHVYLVPEENVTPDTQVQDLMFVDLGRLKAFTGSQNYPIPDGVNLKKYPNVVIWCEQFAVLVSPAKLSF